MKKLLGKFTIIRVAVLAGVIVFAGAGYGWWHMVYSSPQNVFNRMLATSLASNSVTKTINQNDGQQILEQTTQFSVAPKQRVHAKNVLKQVVDRGTVISTESIATSKADYVRYTDIKATQKRDDGKDYDFSSVVGQWGKADDRDPTSGGAQLFVQNLFGVVPLANLPADQRKELVQLIKKENVFGTDFSKTKRNLVNGRPVYSYDISVKPKAYVTMLKLFARDLGMRQLEQVDPDQYEDSEPLNFTFDVDAWSGQLRAIEYKDSVRTERMSAYGAKLQIEPPTSVIPLSELQKKLQRTQ